MLNKYLASPIIGSFLAVLAGALGPLALAPYDVWPLGIVSISLLTLTMFNRGGKYCFWLALLFGLGMYGVGASWVFVSIHQFGSTSLPLSVLLTSLFVAGLSICLAFPFLAYGRWFNKGPFALLLAFPGFWVLDEWMRSWLFTGFPWLYYGYGHLHTPLAGLAPVTGIFGVSLGVALTSCMITFAFVTTSAKKRIWQCAGFTTLLWTLSAGLRHIEWTVLDAKPITIGMAQSNIPQERKWDPAFRGETYRILYGLSESLWQYDWVIWPEAAIPLMYHEATDDLVKLDTMAKATNTVAITGILYDDWEKQKYYNSIVALGEGSGIAFKTRLVPFGEYMPMEQYLRGLINFFDLPTSIIHTGPAYTQGLNAKGVIVAPMICYEVVYPDLVANRAATANVLLTVSNDAWFGTSIGPLQHFQMAQMRALETGRYMVRSTNNGVSGIIDHKGNITVVGGRDTRESIHGEVFSASGLTPFIRLGSWPTILTCLGMVVIARIKRTR